MVAIGVADILNLPLYAGISYHRSQYLSIILALTSVHVFLNYAPVKRLADQTRAPWYEWLCIVGALVCNAYIAVTFVDITTLMEFVNTERLILGGIGILLVFEMVRRTAGWPLIFVVATFILYAVYSDYFPDILYARPATWPARGHLSLFRSFGAVRRAAGCHGRRRSGIRPVRKPPVRQRRRAVPDRPVDAGHGPISRRPGEDQHPFQLAVRHHDGERRGQRRIHRNGHDPVDEAGRL